ncbi:MAG TPA: hypothetical protein VFF30_04300 [Nitrososphaerales archaeon]|nr:hypothetical protein [Nitrososphaerales archaeon]
MQHPFEITSNYVTQSKARVGADKNVSIEQMNQLLARVAPVLYSGKVYTANANLNGISVQLITNVDHQWDFWKENWNEAPSGTVLPHATVYSINGVEGMEPKAYYCSALNTSLFVNTESWYNPYLLEKDDASQERFFRLMFEEWKIPCILLNTGVESVDTTHKRIVQALK